MASNEIEREMAAYYQARAGIYDEIYQKHHGQDEFQAMAAHIGEALAGRDVLEVACGTGFWTERVAAHARSVVATDGLDGPLGEARKRLHSLPNVTLCKADAYALDGVAGEFDGALHVQWYSHLPLERIGAFLDVLHARLKPGATVVMADNYLGEAGSAERKAKWADRYTFDEHGNAYTHRSLPGGGRYRVYKNMPTRVDLEKQLAGRADDVRFTAFPYFWVVTYRVRQGTGTDH